MKKWISCLLLAAAIPILGLEGFGGEDLGSLEPVQVLLVTRERGGIHIRTDSDQEGSGQDAAAALENLVKTASSKVFLDTAEYLLLEPGTEKYIPQLKQYLRSSCTVCNVLGPVDLQDAAQYLQLHPESVNLTQYEAGKQQLLTLIYNEGRMTLVRS